jgi:hypothetical protein
MKLTEKCVEVWSAHVPIWEGGNVNYTTSRNLTMGRRFTQVPIQTDIQRTPYLLIYFMVQGII